MITALTTAQQYEWRTTAPKFGTATSTVLAFDSWRSRVVMNRGSETWEWDGAVWHLRVAANPMGLRSKPGFAFDPGRGVTVLFAGMGFGATAADTWEYDGATWTQVSTPTTPPWRWFGAMTYDSVRQRIYLVGGDTGGGTGVSDMWEYDGVDWTRLFPATMPTARLRHAITFDEARGVIVLFGGLDTALVKIDETWEWNGANWTQRMPAVRPPARMNHSIAYDAGRARTVVFGGIDPPISFRDTWEWDGNAWMQVGAGQPGPRSDSTHAMAYDRGRGELVAQPDVGLVGGGDTWTLDGGSWQLAAPSELPFPSENHGLAYDPIRRETLLFGQNSVPTLLPTETWVFRGGDWQRLDPATTPAGRVDPALAFDFVSGAVLMFGGAIPGTVDETWLWNGVDWLQQSPATSPPPRSAAALASDFVRGRVILFGGQNGQATFDDTWEWDGASWLQRTPATVPPGRPNAGLCFDPARNVTVMFGGGNVLSGPTLGDHWEWNGADWTLRTPATAPPPRSGHGLVYDPDTQTVVAVGGSFVLIPAFPIALLDVWEWNGTNWTPRSTTGPGPPAGRYMRSAVDLATRRTLTFGLGGFGLGGGTWLLGLTTTAAVTPYGAGCSGTFGAPELRARGEPFLGNLQFRVQASSLAPSALALLAFGAQPANAPLPGGCTALTAPIRVVSTTADGRGSAVFPLPLPNSPVLQGLDLFLQAAALDAGGAFANLAALSPGLQVRIDR